MKTALRFVLVLGLICLVMGCGVAVLFAAFQAQVRQKERQQFELALRQVLPEGKIRLLAGSRDSETDVYVERDDQGKAVRYAACGAAQGYSSTVKVVVGVAAGTMAIHRVAVLRQQETPGLGANVSLTRSRWTLWDKIGQVLGVSHRGEQEPFENAFLDQFPTRTVGDLVQVDAITAATITSDAAKDGVREAVARITDALEKE